MSLSKEETRQITGFPFSKVREGHEIWMNRAMDFKEAAILIAQPDVYYSPPHPYYYNAGIALELALKAIAIAQLKVYESNHHLNDLCTLVGLKITRNQLSTLELLSEFIIWSGRYPVPKDEGQWNNYHDVLLRKHVVSEANILRLDRKKFPFVENFLILWKLCEDEYELSIKKIHNKLLLKGYIAYATLCFPQDITSTNS